MDRESTNTLPLDVYMFLGREIRIRSNSPEMLTHLKSMYNRFYVRSEDGHFIKDLKWEDAPLSGMEIINKLDSSNELLINDKCQLYRLSMIDGYSHFTSQDIETSTEGVSGFCDPLTLIQSSLLTTIAVLSPEHHLIHAGVVSLRDKGIILPATSGMGKTTLVLKLVDSGCKFLSDEVACFDLKRSLLEPFPRKLNIRARSREMLNLVAESESLGTPVAEPDSETVVDIEDIIPNSLSSRCSPRFLLFLRGFGEKPRLERISGSNAVFELLNSYIGPVENAAKLLFDFAPLFDEVQCFNLVVGEPDETAECILQLADENTPGNI